MSDELTPWQKYKQSLGDTRPWDMLNPATKYVDKPVADARYEICKGCPELIRSTKQCNICKCFMIAKVKLADATCPQHLW